MDANEVFGSLMLIIRGHEDYAEIDVLDFVGIPNTPEGELMARTLIHQLDRNIRAIESVGDALSENLDSFSEEKLAAYANQIQYCAKSIDLYQALKQEMQELIRGYYLWKAQNQ